MANEGLDSPTPNEINGELLDAFLENAYDTTFEADPTNEGEEQEIKSVEVRTLYIKVPREEVTVPDVSSKEAFTVFLNEKKDMISLYENKLKLLKAKLQSLDK